jgi:hypothetical protein
MTEKPETAPDTAHSAIVTDHEHRTLKGEEWRPCIWTYPDGHVCGVAEAAHEKSITPYRSTAPRAPEGETR